MLYINFLIKLKNAQNTDNPIVKATYSKMNKAIADLLVKHNFLQKAEIKGKEPKLFLEVKLNNNKPIHHIKFLSKPSIKLYSSYKDIHLTKKGIGIVVLSTSRGILDHKEAIKNKVGGQLLFEIW
ncbi:MAG: uS8 family ribosomal protein [Minisyncoccia bacterium]